MNEDQRNFDALSALEQRIKPVGLSLEDMGGKAGSAEHGVLLPAPAFPGPDPIGSRISDYRPCG
ncbi:hypothetical protein [Burkholderia sp. BCC1972]|uniref:hypothetical protein n=1 Tax=Burkholderia sp. BCC1972 TaxID=2817438 RepID=UPI002ABDA2FC|nr:hypothetical protein [Burkholderia sp. BCC1972]